MGYILNAEYIRSVHICCVRAVILMCLIALTRNGIYLLFICAIRMPCVCECAKYKVGASAERGKNVRRAGACVRFICIYTKICDLIFSLYSVRLITHGTHTDSDIVKFRMYS